MRRPEPWFRFAELLLRPPVALWFNWRFEGLEHVPREGAVLVAGKLWLGARYFPAAGPVVRCLMPLLALAGGSLALVAALHAAPMAELAVGLLALGGFALLLWRALGQEERDEARGRLRRLLPSPAGGAP